MSLQLQLTDEYKDEEYPDSEIEDSTDPDNLYKLKKFVSRSQLLHNKCVLSWLRSFVFSA